MRVSGIILAAAVFAAPAFADKKTEGPVYEPNTYRFGGTYSVAPSSTPSQCASTCGSDTRCVSWSFIDKPGAHTQNACELKSNAGKSEENPSAVSGISPRIESKYQPSSYRGSSALLGASNRTTKPVTRTVRRVPMSSPSSKTSVPTTRTATRRVVTPTRSTNVTRQPVTRTTATPTSNVTTSTSRTVKRVAAPTAPAIITTGKSVQKAAAPSPRTVVRTVQPRTATTTTTTKAPVSSAPSVQFTPLKPSADGTYKAAQPVRRTTTQTPSSRVVLTGTKGESTSKAVNGRVVLTGDMAAGTGGGVGETPSAPIPRNAAVNAQGERVPYKDLSSREYPNYSVTQAAEQGSVESVGNEAGS